MKYKDFTTILLNEWQDLEITAGRRITETEFAKYLKISQPLLSTWLAGNTKPTEGKIKILAEKLGPSIYDSLGMIRPDPLLQIIQSIWESIPIDKQQKLVEESTRYAKRKVYKKQKNKKNTDN